MADSTWLTSVLSLLGTRRDAAVVLWWPAAWSGFVKLLFLVGKTFA